MKKSKNVVLYNVAIVALALMFIASMFGFLKGLFTGQLGGGEETTTFTTAVVTVEVEKPSVTDPVETATQVVIPVETTTSSGQSKVEFEIPEYTGEAFYIINNNVPGFSSSEMKLCRQKQEKKSEASSLQDGHTAVNLTTINMILLTESMCTTAVT